MFASERLPRRIAGLGIESLRARDPLSERLRPIIGRQLPKLTTIAEMREFCYKPRLIQALSFQYLIFEL